MLEQRLRDFFAEYKNSLLSQLKTTDKDYKALLENRLQHSAAVHTQTSNTPEVNALLQAYTDCTNDIQDIETDTLYFQGMKDCIKILRLIEVII